VGPDFASLHPAHALYAGREPRRIMMKLSARNMLAGKVVAVEKGQTTAHVKIEIGGGVVITASITNEAVDDLELKVGDKASAVIKASDVLVAK
jgi:molybdopterin-binding protein